MYDLPELASAHDALWAALATRLSAHGIEGVPAALTRTEDLLSVWRDPQLLLSQTCGYPLVTQLTKAVQIVATPIYAAPGCDGADHRSAIVVAADCRAADPNDLRDGVCAINSRDSNTGMNLLRAAIAPLAQGGTFFRRVDVTGSHRESLHCVARGEADVAAIDCVTFALLQRIEPAITAAVRILGWTPASPGLPWITAIDRDAVVLGALRRALADIANDPDLAQLREILLLQGFTALPLAAYFRVSTYAAKAATYGYPDLV